MKADGYSGLFGSSPVRHRYRERDHRDDRCRRGDDPRKPRGRCGRRVGAVQQRPRIADVPEPALGISFQTAGEKTAHLAGHAAQVRLVLDHRRERFGEVLAGEEPPAGEHLVEHDTESPRQDFDGDVLAEGPVLGSKDLPIPPFPMGSNDLVVAEPLARFEGHERDDIRMVAGRQQPRASGNCVWTQFV